MVIIFSHLPNFLDFIPAFVALLSKDVFYLRLVGKNIEDRAKSLKKRRVFPLALEDLDRIEEFADYDSDPKAYSWEKTDSLVSLSKLAKYSKIFRDIPFLEEKLIIYLNSFVVNRLTSSSAKVGFWAKANQDKKIFFISFEFSGLLLPRLPINCRHMVIPISEITGFFIFLINAFISFFSLRRFFQKENASNKLKSTARIGLNPRVAYVTHAGLTYGKLYEKNLFYSKEVTSDFHDRNMLHFDYSNFSSPSDELLWYSLRPLKNLSTITLVREGIRAVIVGRQIIQNFSTLYLVLLLCIHYLKYLSFILDLEKHSSLKLALIDYEALCPKSLLLAFESKQIKTLAVQERFVATFFNTLSTHVSHYLTSSSFANRTIENSRNYRIGISVPVGMYRTDEFFKAKVESIPEELSTVPRKFKKIVTVLGFHTADFWFESQVDPLLNWKSHKSFLEDIMLLADKMPEVFYILRFKSVEWLSLEYFKKIKAEMDSRQNLKVSTIYNLSYYSYRLCFQSDLVIAKYTSLADECLAYGIPVIFHDYTMNIDSIIKDTFDYLDSPIVCKNIDELMDRTSNILFSEINPYQKEYEILKKNIYGNLADGDVGKRIQDYMTNLLV